MSLSWWDDITVHLKGLCPCTHKHSGRHIRVEYPNEILVFPVNSRQNLVSFSHENCVGTWDYGFVCLRIENYRMKQRSLLQTSLTLRHNCLTLKCSCCSNTTGLILSCGHFCAKSVNKRRCRRFTLGLIRHAGLQHKSRRKRSLNRWSIECKSPCMLRLNVQEQRSSNCPEGQRGDTGQVEVSQFGSRTNTVSSYNSSGSDTPLSAIKTVRCCYITTQMHSNWI